MAQGGQHTQTAGPQPPPWRRASRYAPDTDEISAGNAGFENTPISPQERAEYQRGWRVGMGSGLVGGCLVGAILTMTSVWLGVLAGLSVL